MDISIIQQPKLPIHPNVNLAHLTEINSPTSRGRIRTINDWELVLQLEGTITWYWEPSKSHFTQHTGDCVMIPPHIKHTYNLKKGCHLAIHFDLNSNSQNKSMTHYSEDWVIPDQHKLGLPWLQIGDTATALKIPMCQKANEDFWFIHFNKIIHLFPLKHTNNFPIECEINSSLFILINSFFKKFSDKSEAMDSRIIKSIKQTSIENLPSIETLAQQQNMSVTSFRTLFKKNTGMSPYHFFEKKRMERARQLLNESEYSINRIAELCGYSDPLHFSRVCKKNLGASPRHIRKNSIS